MRFDEREFESLVKRLKSNRIGCNELVFSHDRGVISLRHRGPALIHNDDDFLENLYENLLCANTMWFDQLTNQFERIKMTVSVLSDGSIDHNNISFEIRYPIPDDCKSVWNSYMLKQFGNLIPFSKFITDIKFSVTKRQLYHVFCYGTTSGKEINKIQRTDSYNKQIAGQWQTAFFKVNEIKKGQHHIIQEMKVVNGHIRTETVNIEQIHFPGH